jgi:hypothetical protein
MQNEPRKLPFNDLKHPPSRAEIDLLLGVVPSAGLRRLEELLEIEQPGINWSMQWYENDEGWGYRASFRGRVVCVLHFLSKLFTVTLSIPEAKERQFYELRELNQQFRDAFSRYTPSPKMKWVSFAMRGPEDVPPMMAIIRLKLQDIREKTAG